MEGIGTLIFDTHIIANMMPWWIRYASSKISYTSISFASSDVWFDTSSFTNASIATREC